MIAALAWVREHIVAFGGDPGSGHRDGSVGRCDVDCSARHVARGAGLFHRVIMQSGGYGRGAYTSAMATQRGDQFFRVLDIDPQSAGALARLRAVVVPRLIAAQGELARANARFAQTMPMFMPVVPSAMTQPEMLDAIADGVDGKRCWSARRRTKCMRGSPPIRRCEILPMMLCWRGSMARRSSLAIERGGPAPVQWTCWPISAPRRHFCCRQCALPRRYATAAATPSPIYSIGHRQHPGSEPAIASICPSYSARSLLRRCGDVGWGDAMQMQALSTAFAMPGSHSCAAAIRGMMRSHHGHSMMSSDAQRCVLGAHRRGGRSGLHRLLTHA